MQDEYDALLRKGTWSLVPPPLGANIVSDKWIFHHKFHADGSLARHKARWVVRGFTQQPGVDFDDTFSLVVRSATIRIVLSLALSNSWHIHQLDVKKMPSCMSILTKRCIVNNPLVLLILAFPLMYAAFTNHYTVLSKHLGHGSTVLLLILAPLVFLSLKLTLLSLFSITTIPQPVSFSMLMTLFL
jgi:hypothetical protein